jgi:thiol-disulfide isomerase/thioredoxin
MNAYGQRGFIPWRASRLVAPRLSLQRKCACGTHSIGGGECAACADEKRRMQRRAYGSGDEVPQSVHETLAGSGTGLDADTRGFMESRFGHDFSGVRIHADEKAARSAQAVQAHAYTVGRDIVFADGRYAPASMEGRQLLAHELAHVVQQDGADASPGASIAIDDRDAGEAQADHAADRVMSGANDAALDGPSAAAHASGGLQRQSTGELPPIDDESLTRPGPAATCIEEVVGEDIPSLLQAGAITIIEFGAPWCGPCRQNLAGLRQVCTRLREQPPSIPVRIYSINIDEEGNQGLYETYTPGGAVPHLYIYVGSTEKDHYTHGIDPEAMPRIVQEHIDYASTSGAARGAGSGALWGMIPGAVAGIGGAIAIGAAASSLGLGGNALMGAVLGSIAGGVALGAGIGAGIGAIAGAAGDDRNRGPRQQRRRRLQRKAATSSTARSDAAAQEHVGTRGAPLDEMTRVRMERAFSRDFSKVRLHRDAQAQGRTAMANAHALTRGSDIDLAADADSADSARGRAILGHELAHVAQNATAGATASAATLETEAAQASAAVAQGRSAQIAHANDGTPRAMTRGEQTAAGAGIGAAGGAAIGALAGLGIAAATGASLGEGAGIGALIGLGAGALIGLIVGATVRRTRPETPAETEMLIRRRYGDYIGASVPGPLRNASVHVVNEAELCERKNCRFETPGARCSNPERGNRLIGWTDVGPPMQAVNISYPRPVESAEHEPTCNGRQMEHATHDRPVIYYTGEAGTLIHEAMHAYSHRDFTFLHNHVSEGVTEYFSRRLMDDINMPYGNSYPEEVRSAEKLVEDVGEDTVARAYFGGAVPELHRAFNGRHGRCALIRWAHYLEIDSEWRATEAISSGPEANYCDISILGYSPAAMTPGETGYTAPQVEGAAEEPPRGGRDE